MKHEVWIRPLVAFFDIRSNVFASIDVHLKTDAHQTRCISTENTYARQANG